MITFKYKDWEVLKIEKLTDITKDMGPCFTDVVFSINYVIKHTTNSSYWIFESQEERDYVYNYIKHALKTYMCNDCGIVYIDVKPTIPDYTLILNAEDGKAKEPKIHHLKPTIRHTVKYQKYEIEITNLLSVKYKWERTDNNNYALYIEVSNKTFGPSLSKLEFKSKEEIIYLFDKLKEIQNAIPTIEKYATNVGDVTFNQLNEMGLDNIGWKCDINTETGDQTNTYTIAPFIAFRVESADDKEDVQKNEDKKDEKPESRLYMSFEQVLPFYKAGKRITREAYHNTGYKELDMLTSLFIISEEDLIDNISHKCLIANDWYVVE